MNFDMEAVVEKWWEKFDELKELMEMGDGYLAGIEKFMRTDIDYRFGIYVMGEFRLGALVAELVNWDYVYCSYGVPISIIVERLGADNVREYMSRVIMNLMNGRMDDMEVMMLLVRLFGDQGKTVSFEELLRVLTFGNTGKYGKVFKEVKGSDVMEWIGKYRKARTEERKRRGVY